MALMVGMSILPKKAFTSASEEEYFRATITQASFNLSDGMFSSDNIFPIRLPLSFLVKACRMVPST